jgi:hypothetical protein
MTRHDETSRIVVPADRELHGCLERLASAARMVFVAGLPGTGKSLIVHQLAHLAAGAGRVVHLLQWDVVRPVFEASETGRRYPIVDGVTHPMVRQAVGLWSRRAIVEWERRRAGAEHLLIGETPFVGSRLIELARRTDDDAEPILAAASCRFAIPVPSLQVRQFLETERERRASSPLHPREREDAPPHVLRGLWREILDVARALGIPTVAHDDTGNAAPPYDPWVYRRVFEAVLRHRHAEVVALGTVLPTASLSVYDFGVPSTDLVPRADEADAVVREVEARHPDPATLARAVDRWWALSAP